MALNFPDSPSLNQIYIDSASGFSYQWDGVVWKSYSSSASSQISILDDISGSFNDSTAIFPITINGSPFSPANAQQLRIVLGGIVQEPLADYFVSGSNIQFTTPPTGGLSFSGVSLGPAIPAVGIASTGTVYIKQQYSPTGVQTSFTFSYGYTPGFLDVYRNGAKLVSGDDYTASDGSTFDLTPPAQSGDDVEAVGFLISQLYSFNGVLDNLAVSGNATVAGITTLGGNVKVGVGTTALIVEGDVRVTGILTVGTSSITIDGENNQVNVGTGVTIHHTNGVQVGENTLHSSGLTVNNINSTGTFNVGIVTVTGLGGVAYIGITTTAVDKTLVNREYCTVVAAGVTITLPSSPQPGWEVGIAVDNFTDVVVAGNGSNIMALNEDFTMDIAYLALQFVYIDSVQGWRYF